MSFRLFVVAVVGLLAASCASLPPPVPVNARPEVSTTDSSGTRTGQLAIWPSRNRLPGRAHEGFVAGASASGGLVLRDFSGGVLQQLAGPRLADIDLAALPLEHTFTVVIGGTQRSSDRTRIALFRLDTGAGQTARPWGEIETDLSNPRGFCMRQLEGVVHAVILDRRGEARQFIISEGADGDVVSEEIRRFRIPPSGPGCAMNIVSGHLYVTHPRRGFWRVSLDRASTTPPLHLGASVPAMVPRSQSVAIFTSGPHSFLASLDHDSSAISVWRIDREDLTWLGRIAVLDSPGDRRVRNLTSVDAYGGAVEGFPDGLMIVQGRAGTRTSDVRYIDLSAVRLALGLEPDQGP